MQYLAPIGIGVLYALLTSLVREPHRRRLNAVTVAGAGTAYLSGGGMGGWEFPFTVLVTYIACRGVAPGPELVPPLPHAVTARARTRDLRPGDRGVVPAGRPVTPRPPAQPASARCPCPDGERGLTGKRGGLRPSRPRPGGQ